MKVFKRVVTAVLLSAAFFVFADPVINHFSSQIKIDQQAHVLVTENIAITTQGVEVHHGIFRDFPTVYQGRDGATIQVPFNVLSVSLDGKPIDYHLRDRSNGVRVYMGSRAMNLPAGHYVFQLRYQTAGQVGFFKNHDELYWNVTGNGWGYPIQQADVTLQLPKGASDHLYGMRAATGFQGSGDSGDVVMKKFANGQVYMQTTQALAPHQGFTMVVGWPKGFMVNHNPYNQAASFGNLLATMPSILWVLLAVPLVLIYFIIAWYLKGREPTVGPVIPLFTPPKGFSPAACRYIDKMKYDHKILTVMIIQLAVKGIVTIEELAHKQYKLTYNKIPTAGDVTAVEQYLLDALFGHTAGAQVMLTKNNQALAEIPAGLQQVIADQYQAGNFENNILLVGVGFLLSLAAGFLSYNLGALSTSTLFSGFAALLTGHLHSTWMLANGLFVVAVGLLLLIHVVSIPLMRKHTKGGKLLDNQIDGFKMFLAATEKDQMNFRNPPDKTPALFEKYLPYAFALDVEQIWSKQFDAILKAANYQPGWYVGTGFFVGGMMAFGSDFSSSFDSAISSSIHAPGSTSGFGGGFGVGGGGGGGGGGGW